MTLREKLAQSNPSLVSHSFIGGVCGCPNDYFSNIKNSGDGRYERALCPKFKNGRVYSCEECWSREYDEETCEAIPLDETSHLNEAIHDLDEETLIEEHINSVGESLSGNMKRTLFEMRELDDKLSQIFYLLTGKPQEKFEETHEFTNFIGISLKQKQNVEHSLDTVNKILITLKGTPTNEE